MRQPAFTRAQCSQLANCCQGPVAFRCGHALDAAKETSVTPMPRVNLNRWF